MRERTHTNRQLIIGLPWAVLVILPLMAIGFIIGMAWWGLKLGFEGAERFADWIIESRKL